MFNMIYYERTSQKILGIPALDFTLHQTQDVHDWELQIDKDELFKFKKIEDIKTNEQYIVYLNYYNHFLSDTFQPVYKFYPQGAESNNLLDKVPMLERIWEDSINGLVHWLIDWGTECTQLNAQADIDFKKLCKALNTIPKNITLITGAETTEQYGASVIDIAKKHGYNCVTGYPLFNYLNLKNKQDKHNGYRIQKINDILHNKILKYKSLCYNRLPRNHRTMVVAYIIKNNYQNDCLYSLGTINELPRWHWKEHFQELSNEVEMLLYGKDIYPHIREPEVNLQQNQAETVCWEHGLNSYFQLVTETAPSNARFPFITEKSLKPFALLQPFIQYGPKDNIKTLKAHGYDTFDKWINHAYDDIENDIIRLRMVLKEFSRLQSISAETWSTMLKEMLPSLLHNYQLVKKPVTRNLTSQLIPILANFTKDTNYD